MSDKLLRPRENEHGLESGRSQTLLVPIIMLMVVTVLAYANAWPDALVLDDKAFVGSQPLVVHENIKQMFTQDVWNDSDNTDGLYRPLLLLNLSLETRLFGDRLSYYHLSNIFLHVLATLLTFGFFRKLFRISGMQFSASDLCALLAAMVFAVHPIHTEVVNSVFNRSAIFVTIAGVGGLWWLFHYIDTRRGKAWLGLAIAYLFAMFFKENAVVIPGLAVALILLLSQDGLLARIRKCLPVFWLLIPLAFFLIMRAYALTPPESSGVDELFVIPDQVSQQGNNLLQAAAVLGESIKLIAWPYPLRIFHNNPSTPAMIFSLALQFVLISASLILLARGSRGMAAGLAFFYVAMLPASRIHGIGDAGPHLAERYLYFPSIGLAIMLLFGFRALTLRFGSRFVVALGMVSLLVLTALTWDRNYHWSSDAILFETEYQQQQGRRSLLGLVSAHMQNKNFTRISKICDENLRAQEKHARLALTCAKAHGYQGRIENEESSLLLLTASPSIQGRAQMILAKFYVREERWDEAQKYFLLAVELSANPAEKAFHNAEMLVSLHPGNREKMAEARSFYEEALRLQPEWTAMNFRLTKLNKALNTGSSEESENSLP